MTDDIIYLEKLYYQKKIKKELTRLQNELDEYDKLLVNLDNPTYTHQANLVLKFLQIEQNYQKIKTDYQNSLF